MVTMTRHLSRILLPLLLVVALSGCGGDTTGPGPAAAPLPSLEMEYPRRVAVLPFANDTADPAAGEVVRKLFFNFFSSLNYHDVEPFTVDQVLREKNLYGQVVAGEALPLERMCQFLGVDAVIKGRVTHFGKMYALVYSQRKVGLSVALQRCHDGEVLWRKEGVEVEQEGGVSLDLAGLALSMVKTYFNHWKASTIQTAAKLCMSMAGEVPNPLEVAEPPPHITIMVHNGYGRIIAPGEALRVVLIGDPGKRGEWDISPTLTQLPLTEKSPGVYVGEYVVQEGDRVSGSQPVARLIGPGGGVGRWMDVAGGVNLGRPTPAPPIIMQDTTFTSAESPYLVDKLLMVNPGATLTIEPGVTVWVRGGAVVVRGSLQALGEKGQPVRFRNLGQERWRGILVDRTATPSRLRHTCIQGANFGIKARQANLQVESSLFQENDWGIVVDVGTLHLSGSAIQGSDRTGLSVKGAQATISGNRISENGGGGIQLKEVALRLEENDIFDNAQWDLKNHDADRTLPAPNNWWGVGEGEPLRVVGPLNADPQRENPTTTLDHLDAL